MSKSRTIKREKVFRTRSYLEGLKKRADEIKSKKDEEQEKNTQKKVERAKSEISHRRKDFRKFNRKQIKKFNQSFELIKVQREKNKLRMRKFKEKEFFRKGFISLKE